MAEERRLGRGLDSLLGRDNIIQDDAVPGESIMEIDIQKIRRNPLQPRMQIAEEDLAELVESIRTRGLLQPIVVRPAADGYELIAGERRLQASKRVGMKAIPAVIRDVGDEDMLSLALIENLMRVDLNPIEKARAFADLMKRFSLTQEDAAKRVGKERSTIANFVRLLELPEEIQEFVSRGTISMGHARALLALATRSAQMRICERVIREGLSVREVEQVARESRQPAQRRTKPEKPVYIHDLETRLRERLGTKVEVAQAAKGGRIIIQYADNDDLDRLLDVLGV